MSEVAPGSRSDPVSDPPNRAANKHPVTTLAGDAAPAISVTVRYFAAARAASGLDEEIISVPEPATVSAVTDAMTARHGAALARVLDRCSYLLNATAVHDPAQPVHDGDGVDVLPPFAGG